MQASDLLKIPQLSIRTELFRRGNYDFITHSDKGVHIKQGQALAALCCNSFTEVSYGGAAGGAKSWTGCAWLLFMCLCYPNTRYFIAREELKRLKDSTLLTFFKVCKAYGAKQDVDFKFNGQDHTILFVNGSRIDLLEVAFKPSDPLFERYGSSEYTCGWFEEAGEMNALAYDTLKSRCGRQYNDKYNIAATVFVTFNPKKNWVYTYFYRRDKERLLPKYIVFIKALLHDNPHREAGYEEQLLRMSSQAQKERLLFGNFEYDDDPSSLVDYAAICDMFTNEHVPPGMAGMSVDIALQGRDKLVICTWSGCRATIEVVKNKSDAKEVETDIKRLSIDKNIPRSRIVADSDGVGAYLKGYLKGIHAFHGNAKAFQAEYANIKSECAYKLAELINKREIWLICDEKYEQEIKEELAQLKNDDVDNDEGKKRLIGKDEMKAKLGRSPDFLDTLIMGMFVHLKPKIFIT